MPEKYGGIQATIHDLATLCKKRGVSSTVLCQLNGKGLFGFLQRLKREFLRRRHCRDHTLGYLTIRSWNPLNSIRQVVLETKPDIVMLQQTGRYVQIANTLSDLEPAVLLYYHDQSFQSDLEKANAAILKQTPSIANSQFIATALGRHGIHAEVFHPAIDSERLEYRGRRKVDFVLFFNPREEKGLDISLAAAAHNPDIPFVFVEGWNLSREQRRDLQDAIKGLSNVRLIASTPNVNKLFSHAGLLIVPSIVKEAWGRVVTEAQLSGVPVIARDVGGLSESVGAGGILMPPEAEGADWATAIRCTWQDKSGRMELSKKGLQHAHSQKIAGQCIADRLVDHIQKLIAEHPKRSPSSFENTY